MQKIGGGIPMRLGLPVRRIRRVKDAKSSVEARLVLEPGSPAISGFLQTDEGRRYFWGWLEVLAAIESLRREMTDGGVPIDEGVFEP